jgi:hypothetical protein
MKELLRTFWIFGLGLLLVPTVFADRVVLKNGESRHVTVLDERGEFVRILDRYERPRKLPSAWIDSVVYDSEALRSRAKMVFRKGQPTDSTGRWKVRYSEPLDSELAYRTDSLSELDLLFLNRALVRILPGSLVRVIQAPDHSDEPLELQLLEGRLLGVGYDSLTEIRVTTVAGIGVARGIARMGIWTNPKDSLTQILNLEGIVGLREKADSPGELAATLGEPLAFRRAEGHFEPGLVDSLQGARLIASASELNRYRLEEVPPPPIGYWPKAVTGLGFLVFFYGSALGILDYANSL